MAKTKTKRAARSVANGRDWSAGAVIEALRAGRTGDRVEALKRSGIVTKSGKLAPRLRSWGRKASRTPDAGEMGIG